MATQGTALADLFGSPGLLLDEGDLDTGLGSFFAFLDPLLLQIRSANCHW